MNKIIQSLCDYSGSFSGRGTNHDNEEFLGQLKIEPILSSKGVEIVFKATGNDGTVYHEEKTIVAPTENENVGLWTLNNNVPYLYQHDFQEVNAVSGANKTLCFLHNAPEDNDSFREEIAIDLWKDGDVSYRYSWGLPGGEYRERSGLRMKKQ